MEYIPQLIVFILAVLGAFFKGVKEKDGKPSYSRSGLPIPTRAGTIILIGLVLSFAFSLWSIRKTTNESQQKAAEAATSQRNLEARLDNLRSKNDELQMALAQSAKTNYSGFESVLKAQEQSQTNSMDRLGAIISRQESLARNSERNTARTLNQLGADVRLYVELAIPAKQEYLSAYANELRKKSRNSLPYPIDLQPGEPLSELVRWVHLSFGFFQKPTRPKLILTRVPDLAFSTSFYLTLEPNLFEGPLGNPNEHIAYPYVRYDVKSDSFKLNFVDLKPRRELTGEKIRAIQDLRGSQCILKVTNYYGFDIIVEQIILSAPALPLVQVSNFRLISKDKDDGTAVFEAFVK